MPAVGSVVVLNSGGHPMTVVALDEDRLKCAWMNDDDEYDEVWLPSVCVRLLP